MNPIILANQLKQAVNDYLRLSFATTTPFFEGMLERFITLPGGVSKGPYLSIKLPFSKSKGESDFFPDVPLGFTPHLHQEKAFQRIGVDYKSTLVATGTGSGKTECFQLPILNYCYQNRHKAGIKAIFIYPMNALASDQAERLAKSIDSNPLLKGKLTAGIYVGDQEKSAATFMTETRIISDKEVIRNNPPDILLTNYKMLDFLLIRSKDHKLWQHNVEETLKYLVVDELHTFDGAQGTDLACLIRRIKMRLNTPKSHLVCVGTSATLGGDQAGTDLIHYATDIFDETFDDQAVITEYRQSLGDYLTHSPVEFIAFPSLEKASQLDSSHYKNNEVYIQAQAELWFGKFKCPVTDPLWRVELGIYCRRHYVFQNLLRELDKQPVSHWSDLVVALKKRLGIQIDLPESFVELLLGSLVSLISVARADDFLNDESDKVTQLQTLISENKVINLRPLLDVRLQLWQRELRRLLVQLPKKDAMPELIFADDGFDKEMFALPAIHCRDCGAMGWLGHKAEEQQQLTPELDIIYQAFFERSAKSTLLFPMQDVETVWDFPDQFDRDLCSHCGFLNQRPSSHCQSCDEEGLVWVHVANNKISVKDGVNGQSYVHSHNSCPFCESKSSLLIIGVRATNLTSIIAGQLSSSPFNTDKQLIAFSDAVQDTAHRAGYIAARTRPFPFRVAIKKLLSSKEDLTLTQCIEQFNNHWFTKLGTEGFIGTFLPNDMDWLRDFSELKALGHLPKGSNLADLLKRRLAFDMVTEFGFRCRIGRSLERSGAACTFINPSSLQQVLKSLLTQLQEQIGHLKGLSEQDCLVFVLGFLAHLRINGGVFNTGFELYIKENGNPGVFINQHHLPNYAPNARVPVFLATKKTKGFETLHKSNKTSANWYLSWLVKCFLSEDNRELASDFSTDVYLLLIQALQKQEILLNFNSQSGEQVWAINPDKLLLSTQLAHIACDRCQHTHTVAMVELKQWEDGHCLRKSCLGKYQLTQSDEDAIDFYGRLYRDGDINRIVAAEHTGLLTRDERGQVEASFKRKQRDRKPWDINLLAATPTLELGVDIGDLSAVLLCSVPPAQANYLQRVGRAGRRDGNAINITLANADAHDLYFYAEPMEMMAGHVATPGVFLDASAVLERQYTAFCLDCWVKDLGEQAQIPLKLQTVLTAVSKKNRDLKKFPYSFLNFVELHRTQLVEGFMLLFGSENHSQLSDFSINWIKHFAEGDLEQQGSLSFRIEERLMLKFQEMESLKKEAKRVNVVMLKLKNKDVLSPEDKEILDQFETELKALQVLVTRMQNKDTLQFLTDEGLIPNYAFPEQGVLLRSVIYRSRRDNELSTRATGTSAESEQWLYEYERPAAAALSELAPLNTFYAGGRRVQITRIDMRVSQQELWRFCRSCHHSECIDTGDDYKACPRCGDAWWSNVSQKKTMLRLKQVYANTADRKSRVLDDSDDRARQFFTRQLLIDFESKDITAAWRVDQEDWPFGFEFISRADFREINTGQSDDNSLEVTIAGQEKKRKGFKICQYCGMVQGGAKQKEQQHAISCTARKKEKESNLIDGLYLYREFTSEAIRVLLPITSGEQADIIENSFVAALQLGLKEKFGGRIDHLRVAENIEPDVETGISKRYLVIYDSVPGGTGYLKQLMTDQNALLEVLVDYAMPVLEQCGCVQKEGADGCYKCLYVYRNSRNMKTISRQVARDFIQTIKEHQSNIVEVEGLREITISPLVESELEARFIEAINRVGKSFDGFVCRKEFKGTKAGWFIRLGESRYFMEPQVELGSAEGVNVMSRADFVLWPLSISEAKPIVIFTDGFQYHKNRVDKDSAQRLAIVASGHFLVWSLSYDDVQSVLDEKSISHLDLFLEMPKQKYQFLLSKFSADELRDLKGQSSFEWLIAWLHKPNMPLWQKYASAMIFAGYLKAQTVSECNDEFYQLINLPKYAEWNAGDLFLAGKKVACLKSNVLGASMQRLKMGWIVNQTAIEANDLSQVALQCVFDDTNELTETDKSQWNEFLRLINIIQFQENSSYFTLKGIENDLYSSIRINTVDDFFSDGQWGDLLNDAVGDETVLINLLAKNQLVVPVLGYELEDDDGEVLAEAFLVWSTDKIAIIFDESEDKVIFTKFDWTVFTQQEVIDDKAPFLNAFKSGRN